MMNEMKELERRISDRSVIIRKLTPETPAELENMRNSQAFDKGNLKLLREKENRRTLEEGWEKEIQFLIGAVVTDVSMNDGDIDEITLKKGDKKIVLTPSKDNYGYGMINTYVGNAE